MSLSNLQPNGLYVILFLRTLPHTPNNFHWGLYLHHDATQGGIKYHIKQQGSGWIADHGKTASVFKSFLLEGHVNQQLQTYDLSLNSSPNTTCCVWLLWVLALLQKEASGYKLLKCANLSALEAEIIAWGNENAASADQNRQPQPVAVSKYIQG
ncbi:hypothetical protein EJ02DRAFT_444544 [Clathrospora elynae]|uniref:Uncharacterized protein n=1 Tax=Clathrospora elynae TaxID=706981 RepID=A0A6A5SPP9_9PLEO|nr:hypothetical protein EJ02DRAFT_444544 [Clathrospora elynae]